MLLLNELSKYQTKKKLFNPTLIAWTSILFVTFVILYTFINIFIYSFKTQNIKYLNIKGINFQELAIKEIDKKSVVSNNTPTFYINEQKIYLSTYENIILPLPNVYMLEIDLNKDNNEIESLLKNNENIKKIFNNEIIFIANNTTNEKMVDFLKKYKFIIKIVSMILTTKNIKFNKISPVFININLKGK